MPGSFDERKSTIKQQASTFSTRSPSTHVNLAWTNDIDSSRCRPEDGCATSSDTPTSGAMISVSLNTVAASDCTCSPSSGCTQTSYDHLKGCQFASRGKSVLNLQSYHFPGRYRATNLTSSNHTTPLYAQHQAVCRQQQQRVLCTIRRNDTFLNHLQPVSTLCHNELTWP